MNKKKIIIMLMVLIVLSSICVIAQGDKITEKKIQELQPEKDVIKWMGGEWTVKTNTKSGSQYRIQVEKDGKIRTIVRNKDATITVIKLAAKKHKKGEKEEKKKIVKKEEKAEKKKIVKKEKIGVWTNFIAGISNYLSVYDEYSGWAQYGYLYMSDKNWVKWREKVNQAFCDLYLGKECITSKICSQYIDSSPGDDVVVTRTFAGQLRPISIQAEKSLPFEKVDETGKKITIYLYKITYSLENPWPSQLKYRVYLKDAGQYEFPMQTLNGHETVIQTQTDTDAIVYLEEDYNTICLRWDPYIRTYDGNRKKEKCTSIAQYEGAATQPYG